MNHENDRLSHRADIDCESFKYEIIFLSRKVYSTLNCGVIKCDLHDGMMASAHRHHRAATATSQFHHKAFWQIAIALHPIYGIQSLVLYCMALHIQSVTL